MMKSSRNAMFNYYMMFIIMLTNMWRLETGDLHDLCMLLYVKLHILATCVGGVQCTYIFCGKYGTELQTCCIN